MDHRLEASRPWFRRTGVALAVALVSACLLAFAFFRTLDGTDPEPAATATAAAAGIDTPPEFVGSARCASCHADIAGKWKDSHHALAMQHATAASVLGDFDNASLEHDGIISRFSRDGDRFLVTTEGGDGSMQTFEVSHAFGLDPLQQYLVTFPDGRLQALPFAWDARPRAEGGQRWYHLYAGQQVRAGDPLHWTGIEQNWNWMCADCHTTRLERNYRPADDTYATTWSELGVGCEACHGPGSRHVAWAGQGGRGDRADAGDAGLVVPLGQRRGATWVLSPGRTTASRVPAATGSQELAVCAQCHSLRAPMAAGMAHDGRFLETHDIALLAAGQYYDDGQQRGEVYEVGSFLQSRMHAAGVTCSDCHDPHSATLRLPGNATCTQCHSPQAFDTPAHTLHPAPGGPACVDCHMPATTYMGVDSRRDHSFRVPRPDLAPLDGAPDACTGCHKDKAPSWAAAEIAQAFGPERKGLQTWGPAFHAARAGRQDAGALLSQVVQDKATPAIARATAAAGLAGHLGPEVEPALRSALSDPDPKVRGAAAEALIGAPAAVRTRLLMPLVGDPSRIVRLKAGRALAGIDLAALDPATRTRVQAAFDGYVASQEANLDRPEALANLGAFHEALGDTARAEQDYRAALARSSVFVPAWLNLADLYRRSGREAEAAAVLDQAWKANRDDASVAHAIGLSKVRQGAPADALEWLRRASEGAPDNPRYAFVYAVALHDTGHPARARAVLDAAIARHPQDALLQQTRTTYGQ